MPAPRVTTAPLPALEQALADAIAATKSADALAPVTVLIGGTLLRPYLQRRLATILGGHANVAFVTAGELALRLGEPALAAQGRRPMPPLASRVLAGEVARESPGYFEPVAPTPGFALALHRLLRELIQAGIDAAALGAATPLLPGTAAKHEALAGLYAGYEERRREWYGVDECLAVADTGRLDSALLCIYGVWELSAGLQRALDAVAQHTQLAVFLPHASVEATEAALGSVNGWCARAQATTVPAPADPRPASVLRHVQDHVLSSPIEAAVPEPDETVRLLSAPDPTREVRAAARECLAWAAEGIPFHRMAIAYRHADTYRPLVDSVFREAGIPVYLHEGTPLGELPLGRRVLTLLELLDSDLERRAVIDALSEADLPKEARERYPLFSPTRWDTLSRTAGIVGGHEQWRERLAQLRADRAKRLAEDEDAPDWMRDELIRIDSLATFIEDLAARIKDRPALASFGEHLEHLEHVLRTYVRDVDPVLTALQSLTRLDALTRPLSSTRFLDIVRAAIDGMRSDAVLDRRTGAFGRRGVNVLDVSSLRHLRFEAVALLGLVERSWPSPVRQDPLLLDRERVALSEATDTAVPLRAKGSDPEPLQFAVALQAASSRLLASYPRSDRAGGRAQLPSSFLRALASTATGKVVSAEAFDQTPAPLLRRERTAQTGASSGQPTLSAAEHLRTLLETDKSLGSALLRRDPRFARAAEVGEARGSREATPFDGVLGLEAAAALAGHWSITAPMPPTALERYAGCGMAFFLDRVLRVRVVDEPEAVLTIDALTKGSVVHRTLERFLTELGEDDWPQASHRPAHLKRLLAIGNEECDDVEQRGLTGYPMLWEHDRQRLLDDLVRWYDAEAQRGHDLPHRSYELRVGPLRRGEVDPNPRSTDAPLDIEIDGRSLSFQGRIDRVEWDDGGRFRIIDYKTGRVWKNDGDIEGGEALQLPLYVRAAAHALGLDPANGDGEYFYVTRDGDFKHVSFTREDLADQREWVDDVLGTLMRGITSGVFGARPRELRVCDRCAFNDLCDSGRMQSAKRKSQDPRIAPLQALREGGA